MIPDWLHKHCNITKPFTVHSKYLELPPGKTYERLIQAELVPPNTLTSTDNVVVKLIIAMDTVLADSGDHDPVFGISDGTSFTGFLVVDKDNYVNQSPCYLHEGNIINNVLQVSGSDVNGAKVSSQHYSSEITIQIKPNDQWGSCHTEHDEGTINIVNYQHALDITKGLYLEMYRHDALEKYHIKYIVANVYLD